MARQLLRVGAWALGGAVGVSAGASAFDISQQESQADTFRASLNSSLRQRAAADAAYAESERRLARLAVERADKVAALDSAEELVSVAERYLKSAVDGRTSKLEDLREHDAAAAAEAETAAAHHGLLSAASERVARLEEATAESQEALKAAKQAFPIPLSWR